MPSQASLPKVNGINFFFIFSHFLGLCETGNNPSQLSAVRWGTRIVTGTMEKLGVPGLSTVNTGETPEISAISEMSCYYFELIIDKFYPNYNFTCVFVLN